mmetsp:Transcript_17327/g.14453  ORF Transcript_17327/g.14453 Transcript_17327/m.14453 type:complete len:95 (+) Transcript_17327:3-287(+)
MRLASNQSLRVVSIALYVTLVAARYKCHEVKPTKTMDIIVHKVSIALYVTVVWHVLIITAYGLTTALVLIMFTGLLPFYWPIHSFVSMVLLSVL